MTSECPGRHPTVEPDYAVPPGLTLDQWAQGQPDGWQAAMERLGLLPPALEYLLGGVLPVTRPLADRLADVTGISACMWLALEADYRAALARINSRQKGQEESRD